MRICHFSSVIRTPDARSFHRESVPLVAKGIEVTYIGPHGVQGVSQGVRLVPSPWRAPRALRIIATPLMLRLLLKQQADIYQFHDPELIPVALLLRLAFGKRVIYDVWEDFPSMMLNKRYIPRRLRTIVGAGVQIAENLAAKHLNGVVTADSKTLRRLAVVRGSRKLVFLNFPNLHYFPAQQPAVAPFDFVYRGGLSERAGVGLILEAMRIIARNGRKPRVLLVGYADDNGSLESIRKACRASFPAGMIEIRDSVPHEEMAATLSLAKVGLCPLRPIPKFMINIPVKIWEYWACGIPAVATNLPPIQPFFRDGEYGLMIPPDNACALATACEWMMDHPTEAQEMGRNALRAIHERFNSNGEVIRLMRFYECIMRESR